MKLFRSLFLFLSVGLFIFSCKKYKDPDPATDPRIPTRKYCNDPKAVNYNWDFPGVPDNSVCIYPTDLFKGSYLYTDSVYHADNTFDSALSLITYTLQVIPNSVNKFSLIGFCGNGDSLRFTAERTSYRANADTTIKLNDTTFVYGQFFCSSLDTMTGTLTRPKGDSVRLKIDFTVHSDTEVNFHRGTATKL